MHKVRVRQGRISAVLLTVASVLCLAASAQAARTHSLISTERLPGNQAPGDVAASQATHHFYVTTFSSPVYNFDPDGKLDAAQPELPGSSTLEPAYVSVDNSGGPHNGYIYASSFVTRAIQQYDPSGSATAVKITSAAMPPNGTAQGGGLPPVVNNGEFIPRDLEVDPSGNIFVIEQGNSKLDEFTSSGVFVAQFAPNIAGKIDASGNRYITRPEGLEWHLFKLNSALECVPASCAPFITSHEATRVAVDRSTGNIFTTEWSFGVGGNFREYDSSGSPLGVTPLGKSIPEALAVDGSTGNLMITFQAQGSGGEDIVQLYGAARIVPDVETEPAGNLTDGAADLHGKIGAAEVAGATCAFQYVDEATFQVHQFEGAAEAPCEPGGPFSGGAMNDVHAHLSGLQGGVTYRYRLVGTNENGSNAGEDEVFQTLGPSVTGTEASEVTATGARLSGFVDPNGRPTTYRGQYVTQAGFEANGFADATDIPITPATVPLAALGQGRLEAGSKTIQGVITTSGSFAVAQHLYGPGIQPGTTITAVAEGTLTLSQAATTTLSNSALTASSPQPVAQEVTGLTPGTAYRFRIVAENSEGITMGPAEAFTAFRIAPVGLPDARAYEQASPTEKSGTNIVGELNAIQASSDGNRVTFGAYAGIPGGDGQQDFASYMASRGAGAWSTRGMLPPASAGSTGRVINWDEDLANVYSYAGVIGIDGSGRLLSRSSADGSYTEIARELVDFFGNIAAGASAGGNIALLESEEGSLLPGDLAGKQNLYAYDHETDTLVLAGVLNDLSVPPGGAMAGPYEWFGSKDTSRPGGAIGQYRIEAERAISIDGKRIFFTAGGTGQIYVRENPFAQQSSMNGEECTEASTKACTVRISAPEKGVADPGTPAAFAWAAADGSTVYFLDKGKLTTDSTAGAGYDLYRYDLETGKLTDLTVDMTDGKGAQVEGVLGVSAEGNDAYFVAPGVLAEGASEGRLRETNLYAVHGEEVVFVARLSADESTSSEWENWSPRSGSNGGGVAFAYASRVSADGRALLFTSSRQLTAYRNHERAELYLYREGRGIDCVSCNPSGVAPAGPSGVQEINGPAFHPGHIVPIMTRNLSDDGRRVVFDTPDKLVSSDENGVNDVYEWEEKGEGSCDSEAENGGCLFLISTGTSPDPSYLGDADSKGENVFFFTSQQLVGQDKDHLVDVYDARVNGGIAAQNDRPVSPCEAEACLGPGSSGQTPQTPGTTSFAGPGNPPRPVACSKGRTRRHGRCVKSHAKKKHAKKHHKQRRAQRAKGGSYR